MVTEFLQERCDYIGGSLKPFIYLLPRKTTRIDYEIDNYQCEVKNVYADEVIKVDGYSASMAVVESVDNRLKFSSSVGLQIRENWGNIFVDLVKELKNLCCYVVVEDLKGTQYLQTPEFTSQFTYTYEFSSSGNVAKLNYKCDTNLPAIVLNTKLTETRTVTTSSCGYSIGGIKDFRMSPYQYVFIDSDEETGMFTTVTATAGEAMHRVEPNKDSFRFTQTFDGSSYRETIVFRIPLQDYKFYFHYNLVEFTENRYAVIFGTPQGNWIGSGFEFGFMPTYTIETSDDIDEMNFIEITMQHSGQNSIFYAETEPNIVDSTTDVFVPVTQPIKDPKTGEYLQYWHCQTKSTAIYTLVQMMTESGVPTDRYMCLQGYEQVYRNFNIIGTYDENMDFGFELKFTNSECAVKDNCKFTNMTKDVYTFHKSGDSFETYIKNPCPWTMTDIPSWLKAYVYEGSGWVEHQSLSGLGGVQYNIKFTAQQDATENRLVNYGLLKSFDNEFIIQFILEKKVNWINPLEHHINAKEQYVTSYISRDYSDYDVCEASEGLIAEKVRGTSTIRIKVPMNEDESLPKEYYVKVCDTVRMEYGYIRIYQDHLYVEYRNEAGGTICIDGSSYKKVRRYIGYDAEHIDILTNEVITGEKILDDDPQCRLEVIDENEFQYIYRPDSGTVCDNGNKYSRWRRFESHNSGKSWTATDEYIKGEMIEASSPDCSTPQHKYTKYIVDESKYDCYGVDSHYMECEMWSYDEKQWYKPDNQQCRISQKVKTYNDPACSGGGFTPGYIERWSLSAETYCNDGLEFYLERKSVSYDGGITFQQTNEYRESNRSTGEQCSQTDTKLYQWIVDRSEWMCDGVNSYFIERYYYFYSSKPNVFILDPSNQTRKSQEMRGLNDPACGYVSQTKYRWNAQTGGYVCINHNKYHRDDYEVSYDGGETWEKTSESRVGTLIEESSSDCQTENATKWVVDYTRWMCLGTVSYYYNVQYESTDGENWVKTEPEVIAPSSQIRLTYDPNCGSSSTLYRFVNDGDEYLCEYE